MRTEPLVIATELGSASGGLALAASVAVAMARSDPTSEPAAVLLIELGAETARGPTMLASKAARGLERGLRAAGFQRAAARGAICWLALAPNDRQTVDGAVEAAGEGCFTVVFAPPAIVRELIANQERGVRGVLLRADLGRDRDLALLAFAEFREFGLRGRIERRTIGPLGARRALAGIEPGGSASIRASRVAHAFLGVGGRLSPCRRAASQRGQALPLALGLSLALILGTLILVTLSGSVAGAERGQIAVDLAATSAVRSMRDDLPRLASSATFPDGSANPQHLDKQEFLARARDAALQAATRNGLDATRVRVSFPDESETVPMRALVKVVAVGTPAAGLGSSAPIKVGLSAEAEAAPPTSALAHAAGPATASGGGYSGPLAYRQGQPMRPDVAAAFDRLATAAAHDGVQLVINSAYRSDAEQARLFAANPDPRWVAPPGTSLHRCATELDLGPPQADAWLAANAPRFGFLKRYDWEPWHFGFVAGPAPCSSAGNATGMADGSSEDRAGLPAFVPDAFRAPIVRAATRWELQPGLLAAQLEAESGFDPRAISPAGAEGIAQFMPATAATYGLRNPFDPAAAIAAEGHLMADLLKQFGSPALALAAYNAGPGAVAACNCVPAIPETQAYVARILGLMDAAGALSLPAPLEVRLVR